LWFLFFVLLVMKRPIAKFVGVITVAEGIITGWLPGLLATQRLPKIGHLVSFSLVELRGKMIMPTGRAVLKVRGEAFFGMRPC
jgi:hypothetical protein